MPDSADLKSHPGAGTLSQWWHLSYLRPNRVLNPCQSICQLRLATGGDSVECLPLLEIGHGTERNPMSGSSEGTFAAQ